jgi:hypothetical protein
MRIFLIAAAWLWLAASSANAQAPGTTDVRAGDKASEAGSNTVRPPTPQTPAATPAEISHRAMVEEQERRDSEEQAERDRDDRG